MAWTTPVTNWSNGNNFTHDDMNRICGNINYLYPAAALPSYTQNDILTTNDWEDMAKALFTLIEVSGITGEVPVSNMTADTINAVEGLIQEIYDRINLNMAQEVATVYAGDDLYAAAMGSYTDIAENYVRGV